MLRYAVFFSSLLVFLMTIGACQGKELAHWEVNFSKGVVTYVDDKYVTVHNNEVVKYNRTTRPSLFLNITVLQPWYDNVTVEMTAKQFINNEYKPSLLSLKGHMCKILNSKNFAVELIKTALNMRSCPAVGNYVIDHYHVPEYLIPAIIPESKWLAKFVFMTTDTKIPLINYDIYIEYSKVVPSIKRKKNGK